ncbi:MAG: chromosomal replication initiator protein DnaA, partial [Candidatus Thermoplasmatota archaeon]
DGTYLDMVLWTIREPALLGEVAALQRAARDPTRADEVSSGLSKLRDRVALLRRADRPSPVELDRERELQERARQVFEMIVKHRKAEGKAPDISESQVVKAIEGKPTTRDEKTNLIRQYTFDTFVVGTSNRFAHAASVAVAKSPHTAYNPLFVTSGSGLGKTHLLNAIGNAILAETPGVKVVYVTAEGFSNEFKEALSNGSLPEFREKYRTLDVALLDDAHFLSGKGDVQEELFHTFNDLYNQNKQIVLTSDRPPKEIPDLEDRLISRFESGLIADIQPPEYETRLAILRRRARDTAASVEDDVLDFIARRVENNIRELGGSLNRVMAFSSLMGQPVSLDLAREVLRDLGEPVPRGPAEPAKEVQPGHSYLVQEDRPERAFDLLGASVRGGGRGLLITRSNPRRVQEKYEIGEAHILWLTERESSAVETIPPTLERIIYVIEEFMKEGGRGTVMLDGVEYLASSSSFDAVLKFLRRLIDHTSESQFILLVSVSTKTMKEQEVKNLEREMEVLAF